MAVSTNTGAASRRFSGSALRFQMLSGWSPDSALTSSSTYCELNSQLRTNVRLRLLFLPLPVGSMQSNIRKVEHGSSKRTRVSVAVRQVAHGRNPIWRHSGLRFVLKDF